MIVEDVEAVYCLNVRSGFSFAVADAYEEWSNLTEQCVDRCRSNSE
jgi:predicted metal-binding membrane protein